MSGMDPGLQFPGLGRTANDAWFDANVRHQIGLIRVAGGIRNRVWSLLDKTEADLKEQIRDRLANHTGTSSPANVSRLQGLLTEVVTVRSTAWTDVRKTWLEESRAIALAEPKFQSGLLRTVVPVQLDPLLPPESTLRSLVTSKPFEGRTMREWADSIKATDIRRIQDQIRIGLVQGQNGPQISRRVVGTASLRGRNGVTQITRSNAESITLTSVNHYANQARREFNLANADLFEEELYVATLDSATTPICRSLDGERFPVGEGEIPPLHYRCRSLRVAIIDPEPLGNRPFKASTEQQLIREFAEQNDLKGNLRRRESLPRGTKGKFDEFARGRIRELTGTVPAKTNYTEFLRRQGKQFQDDALGPARGKLFRDGDITLKQFVAPGGRQFTLSELAEMHRSAFKSAGLDPADFL